MVVSSGSEATESSLKKTKLNWDQNRGRRGVGLIAPFKDRVGRSGCDPPRGYLTDDIFFNISNIKTHNIPKNSQCSYLFGDISSIV